MHDRFLLDDGEIGGNLEKHLESKGINLSKETYGIEFDNKDRNLYEDYLSQSDDPNRFLTNENASSEYTIFLENPIVEDDVDLEAYKNYFKLSQFKIEEIEKLVNDSTNSFENKIQLKDIEGSSMSILRSIFPEFKSDHEVKFTILIIS
jgi:hypothetical protein